MGFRQRPGIEGKSPEQSLRRARLACMAGAVFSALLVLIWLIDVAPTALVNASTMPIFVGLAVAMFLGAMKCSAIIRAVQGAFAQLGKNRFFTFHDAILPLRIPTDQVITDPTGAVHQAQEQWYPLPWTTAEETEQPYRRPARIPDPVHNQRWVMSWVPYSVEQVIFTGADDRAYSYWQKIPGADAEMTAFRQRQQWLQQHHPQRYDVVERWWKQVWIIPEIKARHGAIKGADKAVVAAVLAAHEVELLMGCLVAADAQYWSKRIGYGYEYIHFPLLQTRLRQLEADDARVTEPPALPTRPRADHFFIGKGFKWDTRHAQAYEDLRVRDIAEVSSGSAAQGDPRTYGLGYDDEQMVFCDTKALNVHAGIFGSTGVGKTRYVEPLIVQIIRGGYPLTIIDPKGDADLTDRTFDEARICGRGHQICYYSLILPKNRNTPTYNPLNHYADETFLGGRLGSVIPDAKDPFWKNTAIKTAREILMMCHYAREFLRLIDRDPQTGALPPRDSRRVPKLLLMMQLAADDAEMTPAAAEAAVDTILRNMDDPTWIPTGALVDVVAMARNEHYAPVEWNPTIRQVTWYGLDHTVAFVGWMLKVLFGHVYLGADNPAARPSDCVSSFNDNEILSRAASVRGRTGLSRSLWMLHKEMSGHPLAAICDPQASIDAGLDRWVSFYRYRFADADTDWRLQAGDVLGSMTRQLDSLYTMASMEREKFLEQNSTLSSALNRFKGSRERIICATNPDITWADMVENDLIVYCALGQLVDPDGAAGCAKMMVQDIASYVGEIYSFKDQAPKPWFLICDEIASFINEPVIDLLNKARGAGAHIVVIGQSIPDFEAVLQDRAKAQQVLANLNTKVQLRSGLPQDAEEFAKLPGKVNIEQTRMSHGIRPGIGDAGNINIQGYQADQNISIDIKEVDKVSPSAILNLPVGQAYVHMQGDLYLVAQGMFPKPRCNMKAEYHMEQTSDGVPVMHQVPLFEEPLDEDGAGGESWCQLYALTGNARSDADQDAGASAADEDESVEPQPGAAAQQAEADRPMVQAMPAPAGRDAAAVFPDDDLDLL